MQPDHKNPFLSGVTPLSVVMILLGLILIGFMIQVGEIHAGSAFMIGGLFALPLRPVMFVVPLVLISGLVFWLTKRSLFTRAELVALAFEDLAKSVVVVDFSVEDDPDRAVLV